MKSVALALLLLVAGSTAAPQVQVANAVETNEVPQSRFVEDLVASALEAISAQMQDLGLDPLVVTNFNGGYALPVPSLFNMEVNANDVQMTGLSNIVIHNINYSIWTLRVEFDISLPEIFLSVGSLDTSINTFGTTLTGGFGGSIKVKNAGIRGTVRINIGIISGISVSELDLNVYLDGIESAATRVEFMGIDYSRTFNHLVGDHIPTTFKEFSADINEMVELIAWMIIDELL